MQWLPRTKEYFGSHPYTLGGLYPQCKSCRRLKKQAEAFGLSVPLMEQRLKHPPRPLQYKETPLEKQMAPIIEIAKLFRTYQDFDDFLYENLTEAEYDLISDKFGLNGQPMKTYQEIADGLGLARWTIGLRLRKIFTKIKDLPIQ